VNLGGAGEVSANKRGLLFLSLSTPGERLAFVGGEGEKAGKDRPRRNFEPKQKAGGPECLPSGKRGAFSRVGQNASVGLSKVVLGAGG